MAAELVPVFFKKIMQSRSYTVIVLGTEKKSFAIYTDPSVGQNIQKHLIEGHQPRPFTHNLINSIFKGLQIKILQIVINDVEDTIYFARLFIEQNCGDIKQIIEIDARPSDCIILALINNNVPIYSKNEVLEKAISIEE